MRLWRKFLGMSIDSSEKMRQMGKPDGYTNAAGDSFHPPFVMQPDDLVSIVKPADPICWKAIQKLAANNAAIYEEVFRNVPTDAMPRYDSVLEGFPSAGWNEEKKAVERYVHTQPPDLQPAYMAAPSVMEGDVTTVVGCHNVAKGLARLRGRKGDPVKAVQGFWVSMPLEWGHGMDDPASALPSQLIAAAPTHTGLHAKGTHMASVLSTRNGRKQG